MSILKQKQLRDKKARENTEKEIEVKCQYCKHSEGENEKFKHMWYCSFLKHYTTAYRGCDALRKGKGNFEVDVKLYNEWKNKQNNNE